MNIIIARALDNEFMARRISITPIANLVDEDAAAARIMGVMRGWAVRRIMMGSGVSADNIVYVIRGCV